MCRRKQNEKISAKNADKLTTVLNTPPTPPLPRPNIVTQLLTIQGQPCKVHGLSTGSMAASENFGQTPHHNLLGRLSFLWSRRFSDYAPVWVWAIEHPTAGRFLIDTGARTAVNDPYHMQQLGAFYRWLYKRHFSFRIGRDEEIDQLLSLVQLKPQDIDTILLTHLHIDHIDGLRHFRKKPVWVHQLEWERPVSAHPELYPEGFAPECLALTSQFGSFQKAMALTSDQTLWMVHTPGHTYGHSSIILHTDQGYLFFAGDAIYQQQQLENDAYGSTNVDFKLAKQTYAHIRAFAQDHPTVLLPSHDAAAAARLRDMTLFG